jgi:transcriptional regulator with XRE-family HTH domain
MVTGLQIRMARAALGWSIVKLASLTEVSVSAIQRAEQSEGVPSMRATSLFRIERALLDGGVVFVGNAGEDNLGPGVRLRKREPRQ